MGNKRWMPPDNNDIVALAADDYIPVTDHSDSDTDKYFTPLEMAVYVAKGFTLTGALVGGAQTISGTAFDINGGAIDAVTLGTNSAITNAVITTVDINGGAIDAVTLGTNSAITNAQIDNININGNTISNTADQTFNITPLVGNDVLIDGAVSIDSGVVAGITDLTATDITSSGIIDATTVKISKTLSFDGTSQNLTGAGAVNATTSVTQITTGAGAAALTIDNGTVEGQIKYLYMVADGGGDATLTEAGWTLVFADVNDGATLIWDYLNTFWRCVGAAGAVFTP
jgi:hypothetical protein